MISTAARIEDLTLNVTEEIHVHASLEATFAALLEQLGPFNETAEDRPMPMKLEPWPGGRYYVNLNGHEGASGEVLEIIPERRLVFSWGWADGSLPLRPGESTVEISLEPDGDGTRLRLTHRDLPSDMHAWHGRGWDYALPRLAVVAAGRDPGPDPLRSILRGTLMAARSLPPRYLYRLGRQRLRTLISGRPQS